MQKRPRIVSSPPRWRAAVLGLQALLVIVLAGCGGSDRPHVVVVGQVSYAGQPIEQGLIRFVPTGGTTGPAAVAPIVNSRYKVDAHGGLPVGEHRVQVEAYRALAPEEAVGLPVEGPDDGPPRVNFLPPIYNQSSSLTVTIPADNPEFVFDLDLPETAPAESSRSGPSP